MQLNKIGMISWDAGLTLATVAFKEVSLVRWSLRDTWAKIKLFWTAPAIT